MTGKEEQASKQIFEAFLKEMHELTDDYEDKWCNGFSEAILNLTGDFTNGQCDDCPFGHNVSYENEEFAGFEHDLRCSLDECWITRIKKLIWKEQEMLRKSIKTMTVEILEKAYDEIISKGGDDKARFGRVSMDELFKYIRQNYIKKLTVAQFKEFMEEIYEQFPLGDFTFERASASRAEVKRYGFIPKTNPTGMYFYIHKGA